MKHWIWHVHGYGAHEVEGEFALDTKICGYGAPTDLPFIYWVLTASEANKYEVVFDDGSTMSTMKKGKSLSHHLLELDTWAKPLIPTAKFGGFNNKRIDLGHGCDEGIA